MGWIQNLGWAVLFSASFCASQAQTALPDSAPKPDSPVEVLPCGQGNFAKPGCTPSAEDLKKAKAAFAQGLKHQQARQIEAAFEAYDHAAMLAPQNMEYLTTREMARQQLVLEQLNRGNQALSQGHQTEAMASFRSALQLDPKNEFAQQRLQDSIQEWAPKLPAVPQILQEDNELHLAPSPIRASFHYRGDGQRLLMQVTNTFGIKAIFDESVLSRRVHFDITDVDFYTAMKAASAVTHTFWTPLQSKQVLIAIESADNHRKFDRMAMRTIYMPGISSPTDLANLVTVLRNLFDIKLINSQAETSTLTIRAQEDTLNAATQFLETLDSSRPEIMLDVEVYEIDHTFMRNMGVQIPNQFQLFNIPAGALAALGGSNIQDLINQLISSGGINQANSQAISALLAQLGGQQNSIFSQPLATFGNGKTLSGVSLGTLSAQLSLNESWVKHVQHSTLRASQGTDSNFRMGVKYPILNTSFAPIFNSSAISQVIQNNSFQAPFPSFTYEDIGLIMKAKPSVNGDGVISLQLQLELKTLAGPSINGVPVLTNREYQGSLTLQDGEPAVVAGAVTNSEQSSMTGIPGFGFVPGLNKVMTTNSKQEEKDELLLMITPHVVRNSAHNQATEIWLPH